MALKKAGMRLWLILTVIGVAFGILGGFAWWQKDNILVIMNAQRYSKEELADMIEQSELTQQEAVVGLPEIHTMYPSSDYEKQIAEILSRAYTLRSQFIKQLNALAEQAKSDYRALPASKRTMEAKSALVLKYAGQADVLERECDTRMKELIAQAQVILHQNGVTSTLPEQMAYAYANEKSLRKSYYLRDYTD